MSINPVIVTTIDKLADTFDNLNLSIAPMLTIEFQSERDLDMWLNQLHKELAVYSKNGVVMRPRAGEVNKFNDVLCVFKLRSS